MLGSEKQLAFLGLACKIKEEEASMNASTFQRFWRFGRDGSKRIPETRGIQVRA